MNKQTSWCASSFVKHLQYLQLEYPIPLSSSNAQEYIQNRRSLLGQMAEARWPPPLLFHFPPQESHQEMCKGQERKRVVHCAGRFPRGSLGRK